MGLLTKIFGTREEDSAPRLHGTTRPGRLSATPQPEDAELDDVDSSRQPPRRELVQVVLHDTLQRHGIPSNWIEARILATQQRRGGCTVHVLLTVREASEQLMSYVHAFQESFLDELVKYQPRGYEWTVGLSWQFDMQGRPVPRRMPDPASWGKSAAAGSPAAAPLLAAGGAAESGEMDEETQLKSDLMALYAIRDAAMDGRGTGPPDFEDTLPGPDAGQPGAGPPAGR